MTKTILVTGGAGYIGSHAVKRLDETGFTVLVLDDLSAGNRDFLPAGELVVGKCGDEKLLDALFQKHRIDAVMHFAGKIAVGESVAAPLLYHRNNVAETLVLLDAVVKNSVPAFIFSSSAAVYGQPRETPIAEAHPCRPINPYGFTKHAIERVLSDCADAYGLRYAALRYFNAAGADPSGTIGEMHNPETHLIPLVLQTAAGKRRAVQVFGTDYPTPDGTCIRDYVHVSDLADAHLLVMNALLDGQPRVIYNLGNSRGHSVKEVIAVARKITGRPVPVETAERREGDAPVLVADSKKIRSELGWKPRFESLESIVESAWNWLSRGTFDTP